MQKVTVMGLGAMGSAIATCLHKHDYDLSVWNRSPGKAEEFESLGVKVAATPEQALDHAEFVIVCIKGHKETNELLKPLANKLTNKTICDLSTGDTEDAEQLVSLLNQHGSNYLIGMINAYPSGIGAPDTAILTIAQPETWATYGDVIKTLGGASDQIGSEPAALAAMFAGLFSVRQGFMFGMIYGATVCRAAGVPLSAFADQIPASIKLVHDYYDLFVKTVPTADYDEPEASLRVYARAQADALNTFKKVGAPSEFIELIHKQTRSALDAGFGDKQLTYLVEEIGR